MKAIKKSQLILGIIISLASNEAFSMSKGDPFWEVSHGNMVNAAKCAYNTLNGTIAGKFRPFSKKFINAIKKYDGDIYIDQSKPAGYVESLPGLIDNITFNDEIPIVCTDLNANARVIHESTHMFDFRVLGERRAWFDEPWNERHSDIITELYFLNSTYLREIEENIDGINDPVKREKLDDLAAKYKHSVLMFLKNTPSMVKYKPDYKEMKLRYGATNFPTNIFLAYAKNKTAKGKALKRLWWGDGCKVGFIPKTQDNPFFIPTICDSNPVVRTARFDETLIDKWTFLGNEFKLRAWGDIAGPKAKILKKAIVIDQAGPKLPIMASVKASDGAVASMNITVRLDGKTTWKTSDKYCIYNYTLEPQFKLWYHTSIDGSCKDESFMMTSKTGDFNAVSTKLFSNPNCQIMPTTVSLNMKIDVDPVSNGGSRPCDAVHRSDVYYKQAVTVDIWNADFD